MREVQLEVDGAGHAALGARRARSALSDAARDDPRPRHAAAPAVRAVLRLPGGPVARAADAPLPDAVAVGHGALSDRRGDRRRLDRLQRRRCGASAAWSPLATPDSLTGTSRTKRSRSHSRQDFITPVVSTITRPTDMPEDPCCADLFGSLAGGTLRATAIPE